MYVVSPLTNFERSVVYFSFMKALRKENSVK